ncbi:glycosyltransferase family 87 protein [Actinophytocola oryzae]|uniref:Alpha-1,2-mannosyltransferase n=1 Tax=Actinophytocola oryzae TaxID=502181 RepID=A0A4R7VJR0_9PSEU|nr:glycosyltransferase family 87 protein [Actinophytocola oryzae]TDV49696.1 alpha-1,2-mannosyltransferase [Actinophytocola oryzae]
MAGSPRVSLRERARDFVLAPSSRRHWQVVGVSLAVVVVLELVLVPTFHNHFIDLHAYWQGNAAWSQGRDLYGSLSSRAVGWVPDFIYPPFALIALAPFTLTSFAVAKVTIVVANVACLAVSGYVVLRRLRPTAPVYTTVRLVAVAMPVLAVLEPVRTTVGLGQINILLMTAVLVDCLAPTTRLPRGVLVGLAAAVKITPAAFLLFFLLRRDYRALATAAITTVVATGAGFALAPRESTRFFLGGVLFQPHRVSGPATRENQTIAASLSRLHLPDGAQLVARVVLILVVLVAGAIAIRYADRLPAVLATATVALLVSPLSWVAHWVWLAMAWLMIAHHVFTTLADETASTRRRRWAVVVPAVASVAFVVSPHDLASQNGPSWSPWEHLVVHTYPVVAIAFLVVAARLALRRRHAGTAAPS